MPTDPNAGVHLKIRRIMNSMWDTIGVGPLDDDDGEYASYSAQVYEMLKAGAAADEIADYLDAETRDYVMLTPNRERSAKAAEAVVALAKEMI